MRLALTIVLFVAVARPAHACELTIVRAPEDVRAALASTMATEPCRVALEVRVIPTDAGLYVLARDFGGRVRERVVPDGRTAAVLVASWAADNRLPGQPVQVVPELPVITDDDEPAVEVHHESERRLELFAMLPLGARVAVDLVARDRFTAGLAGTLLHRGIVQETGYNNTSALAMTRQIAATDAQAFGYVAGTFGTGHWTLRTSLGAGVLVSHVTDHSTSYDGTQVPPSRAFTQTMPFGDLTLMLGRDFATSWGLDVSFSLEVFNQSLTLTNEYTGVEQVPPRTQGALALGIRHYL